MFEKIKETGCTCNREHKFLSEIIVEKGAVSYIGDALRRLGAKSAFVVSDKNTFSAAGEKVLRVLEEDGINFKSFVFPEGELEPNEENVGLAVMNFDPKCDAIVGVGSGVINDICKIVSNVSEKKYVIVATAPSMDGYASATSSMIKMGHKVSINSRCADVIIGDIDVLKASPVKMMVSGLGDMVAKYVAICEWRISALINGEYYCEDIAELVREALDKCVSNADGLLNGDEEAAKAVFEGLIKSGAAMNFAGLSRPASGTEHYLSHILDMRAIEFNAPMDLHGIQCAIGTVLAVKLYENLKDVCPSEKKALEYVQGFDYDVWKEKLRAFFGKGAEVMIALEQKEQKYSAKAHKSRISVILDKWDEIIKIINEELPSSEELTRLFRKVGLPESFEEIGVDKKDISMMIASTKDIRDKYILTRLLWDIGKLEEFCK